MQGKVLLEGYILSNEWQHPGAGLQAVMELGQVGRHRLDQKHELGLKEPDFGRIHPVGGQLDGEHCKGDLAIKV